MTVKKSLPDLYRLYGGEKSIYPFSICIGGFIESALIVIKRSKLQYDTILPLVTTIDFSNNSLHGDIPTEVTYLLELKSLILSRNELVGLVPDHFGDMKQLESLLIYQETLYVVKFQTALHSYLHWGIWTCHTITSQEEFQKADSSRPSMLRALSETIFAGCH